MQKILLILSFFALSAFAQDDFKASPDDGVEWSKKLTVQDMKTILNKIENKKRKDSLSHVLDTCSTLQYLKCNLAIYDLKNVGLLQYHETVSGSYVQNFDKDFRSNRVLFGIQEAMSDASYSKKFKASISPAPGKNNTVSLVHAVDSIQSLPMNEIVMRSLESYFGKENGSVRMRFSDDRMDFIRVLTYAYALQKDETNVKIGLEILHPLLKDEKEGPVAKITFDNIKLIRSMK